MTKFIKLVSLLLVFNLPIAVFSRSRQPVELHPVSLMCEDMVDPPVLETRTPRFSWLNVPSDQSLKGKHQTAYQIRVATSPRLLQKGRADVWDSRRVESDASYLVPYAGPSLRSGEDYVWQVRTWDERGVVSPWSECARFGVGLDDADWKARWIGAPWQDEQPQPTYQQAPMFRKDFRLSGRISRVKAYITAMGYFEFYANGQRIGEDYLVPNITNYTHRDGLRSAGISIDDHFRDYRIMYLAYDLTDLLSEGDNTLGVLLGNGWANCFSHWVCPFGSPRFICQVEVSYEDGRRATLVTDESWLSMPSPLVKNDIYEGEVYDARLYDPLWCSPSDAQDSRWQSAALRQAPDGRLTAHDAPTDKLLDVLRPTSLTRSRTGEWTVTFDHEISGWLHFHGITGEAGSELSVTYICESHLGEDRYIFRGDGPEDHHARFTWYVFSKAVIRGVEHLTPEMVTAESIGTDVRVDTRFDSSDRLLNRINRIWQQSQIDNMHGCVASDCPHRERSPYTGDGQVASPAVMENFSSAAFYRKWLRDMRDTQNTVDGYVPNSAPWQPGCGGGVAWGAAMNIISWELYLHTGDVNILSDNYFAMQEQVRHMTSWLTPEGTMKQQKCNVDGNLQYWLNLGDWAPAFGLPSDELVHTFYLWYCADLTAKAAAVLGDAEGADRFSKLAGQTAEAFHRCFYNPETKSYGDFGSNVFALTMGVPEGRRAEIVESLRSEIADAHASHLDTGIFGTRFLFTTLCRNGLEDLALSVLRQRDFPGFGWWIEQGATVTWEQWNGNDSHNHPMFGGGLVSLYRDFVGVNIDPQQPGYRHLIIHPVLPQALRFASYETMTPYGRIACRVAHQDGHLHLTVTLPPGIKATVVPPATPSATIDLDQGTYELEL